MKHIHWLVSALVVGIALSSAGSGWCSQYDSGPTAAAIAIPEYVEIFMSLTGEEEPLVLEEEREGQGSRCNDNPPDLITVPGKVNVWGQGVLANGIPNYALNGGDPTFAGGTITDQWPNGQIVPYCRGAVGRTRVTLKTNSRRWVCVKVASGSRSFLLRGQAGATINAAAVLGWSNGCGMIVVGTTRPLRVRGTDSSTWLYVMAKRKGILDRPGLYVATVIVEASAL